jgi:hypothetical protein
MGCQNREVVFRRTENCLRKPSCRGRSHGDAGFGSGGIPRWQPVALVDILRLMPQKIPDYRVARTSGTNAVWDSVNSPEMRETGNQCQQVKKM